MATAGNFDKRLPAFTGRPRDRSAGLLVGVPFPRAASTCPRGEETADPLADALPAGLGPLELQIRCVAPQEITLLLVGETGTGKTRLARLIHELSPRRAEPFLVVDCGALAPTLIESELFGHAKGAFTGANRDRVGKLAAAGRGTLLLDEVNSLPLPLQAKLLRAAGERVFEPLGSTRAQPLHARLIAASNADLRALVAEGRFRADLYYRLNVVAFFLPPLRQRRASIRALARKFFNEFTARGRLDVVGLGPQVLRALEAYDWPGNLHELRNVVERAVALCAGPEVGLEDLPEGVRAALATAAPLPRLALPPAEGAEAPRTLAQSKREAEVRCLLEALRLSGNNRCRAARALGISRIALYKKLQKYGLMEGTSGGECAARRGGHGRVGALASADH
jgi:two-component system response regulator HydG